MKKASIQKEWYYDRIKFEERFIKANSMRDIVNTIENEIEGVYAASCPEVPFRDIVDSATPKPKHLVADTIIYINGFAVCAIEFKGIGKRSDSFQREKYGKLKEIYGIPTVWIDEYRGKEYAMKKNVVISIVKNHLNSRK